MNAIGKRASHGRAGVKSAQDNYGLDGRAGQLCRDVVRDPRQADDLDLKHLSRGKRTLEVRTGHVLQTQYERTAGDRAFDRVGVHGELISDRCPDQIRAIRIEPLLHEEIDLPQINDSEVDRQFLGIPDPAGNCGQAFHLYTICTPSI